MTARILGHSAASSLQALHAGLCELAAGAAAASLAGSLVPPRCRSAAFALGRQQPGWHALNSPQQPSCGSEQWQQLVGPLLQQVQQQQQYSSSVMEGVCWGWEHSRLTRSGSVFGHNMKPPWSACTDVHSYSAARRVYLQHSDAVVSSCATGSGTCWFPHLHHVSRHAGVGSMGSSSVLWTGPGSHRSFSSRVESHSGYVLDYVHTQQPQASQLMPTSSAAEAQASPDSLMSAATAAAGAAAAAGGPGAVPRGRVVAVAVSGGVDSAVSALLLQQQGYQVFGVYMHNWDAADEAGAGTPTCTSAADLADAQALCKSLNIPLYEADFVSCYWNEVFETFLQGLSQGLTPNPDLACNSHIKFGALLQFAREKGADLLATGHYARLGWEPTAAGDETAAAGVGATEEAVGRTAAAAAAVPAAWQPVLLAGSDPEKDQSYFLASLTHQQLAQAMFPVGHMTKAQVRNIAAAAGLSQATKRSSAGICFIGRRSFGKFLEAYLQPRPGLYVDADSGAVLGPCSNMLAVTVGQKALGLGGQQTRVYVAGKDLAHGVVHVVAGHEHPALYSSRVLLRAPNWVSGQPPAQLRLMGAVGVDSVSERLSAGGTVDSAAANAVPAGGQGNCVTDSVEVDSSAGVLHCQYQARYRQSAAECSVRVLTAGDAAAFKVSRFCSAVSVGCVVGSGATNTAGAADIESLGTLESAGGPVEGHRVQGAKSCDQFLVAELAVPLRGVAPGQMLVLYDGEVCLGSATIVAHGPTLAEQ